MINAIKTLGTIIQTGSISFVIGIVISITILKDHHQTIINLLGI